MAAMESTAISQSLISVFDGNNYGFWRIKMRTLFLSQDLLDLVEDGYSEETENMTQAQRKELKENRKKDAKALLMIQQGVTDSIFPRVAAATTSKEAWDILKLEFQGSEKVIDIKIQNLLNEFENLSMKQDESIQDFITRVTSIVTQTRALGEELKDQKVVRKVLRNLSDKYEHVVAACQIIWTRRILEDLHQFQQNSTQLFCDNMAAVLMSKNPSHHGRTKHINIRHHFLREQVSNGLIDMKSISTNEQVADILTKAFPPAKFQYFRRFLGVTDFASREGVEW